MSPNSFWVAFWAAFLLISVSAFAVMALVVSFTAWADLKCLLRRSAARPPGAEVATRGRAAGRTPPA